MHTVFEKILQFYDRMFKNRFRNSPPLLKVPDIDSLFKQFII